MGADHIHSAGARWRLAESNPALLQRPAGAPASLPSAHGICKARLACCHQNRVPTVRRAPTVVVRGSHSLRE